MERLTALAFGQRRKMLRGALKPLGGEALLQSDQIAPARRAETLTVREFETLMQAMLKEAALLKKSAQKTSGPCGRVKRKRL